MTRVRVWLLGGKQGWFRYHPTYVLNEPREDALREVRQRMRAVLWMMKQERRWNPAAVAYEVVREDR